MGTLKEDINKQADWIVKSFAEDKLRLDYSITSLIAIDKFFLKNTVDGKAKPGGRLSKNMGGIIFSIGAYIGNTIIKNVPGSFWETDDEVAGGEIDVAVKLPNDIVIWPVQRAMNRFKNGGEDSIYVYGYEITKEFTGEKFDGSYWEITKVTKPWWKFW
jgi:hypothetical protein